MRVLWLCNQALGDSEASSGTWLDSMARGLLETHAVDLGIIALGPVRHCTRHDYSQVKQWIVPSQSPLGRDGLPSASVIQAIMAAAKEFSPDLIQSWGTEKYWGLLSARGLLPYPSLLEIQGLKGPCARVYYGGLSINEQIRCVGIKEVLKRRTMSLDRWEYAQWGTHEEEIIRGHRFVDVQSPWVVAHVTMINPTARLFPTDLLLRRPFYDAKSWQPPAFPTVFCTAAYPVPYKGLHVAIRALARLRRRVPDVHMRIAGVHQREGIRQDGYIRWVNRLVRQLGLTDAIEWLGALNAEQIVTELQNAGVAVLPTFVENCCTAMQEAMAVGTPVVVSYAGGIPSLANDEESCLFFPAGDEAMCAYQLERALTDGNLAKRLSREARKIAKVRNDRRRIVNQQMDIYRQVIETK